MPGIFGHRQIIAPVAEIAEILFDDNFLWMGGQPNNTVLSVGTPDTAGQGYGKLASNPELVSNQNGTYAHTNESGGTFKSNYLIPESGKEWGTNYHAIEARAFLEGEGGTNSTECGVRSVTTANQNRGIRLYLYRPTSGNASAYFRWYDSAGTPNDIIITGANYPADTIYILRIEAEIIDSTTLRVAASVDGTPIQTATNITVPSYMTTQSTAVITNRGRAGSVSAGRTYGVQIDTERRML